MSKVNKILKAKFGDDIFIPDISKILYSKSISNINMKGKGLNESDIIEFIFLSHFIGITRESQKKGYIRVPAHALTEEVKNTILEMFPIFQVKTLTDIEYLSVPVKVLSWIKWIKEVT